MVTSGVFHLVTCSLFIVLCSTCTVHRIPSHLTLQGVMCWYAAITNKPASQPAGHRHLLKQARLDAYPTTTADPLQCEVTRKQGRFLTLVGVAGSGTGGTIKQFPILIAADVRHRITPLLIVAIASALTI